MDRNMFVYKDNYGDENKVALVLDMYRDNGNLFVGFEEYDEEYDYWDSYCDVTVNVGDLPYLESAINIELSGQEKIDFLVENGFGELTGKSLHSGFLNFPVFRFNAEKLKELDSTFFEKYSNEHGVSVDARSDLNVQFGKDFIESSASEKSSLSDQITSAENNNKYIVSFWSRAEGVKAEAFDRKEDAFDFARKKNDATHAVEISKNGRVIDADEWLSENVDKNRRTTKDEMQR